MAAPGALGLKQAHPGLIVDRRVSLLRGAERGLGEGGGSPGRTRTYDLAVNPPQADLLYRRASRGATRGPGRPSAPARAASRSPDRGTSRDGPTPMGRAAESSPRAQPGALEGVVPSCLWTRCTDARCRFAGHTRRRPCAEPAVGAGNWLPGSVSQSVLRDTFPVALPSLEGRRRERATARRRNLDRTVEWRRLLATGEVQSRAALARHVGVSRACVTQALGPMGVVLAPRGVCLPRTR